jgi:hypothetical protein
MKKVLFLLVLALVFIMETTAKIVISVPEEQEFGINKENFIDLKLSSLDKSDNIKIAYFNVTTSKNICFDRADILKVTVSCMNTDTLDKNYWQSIKIDSSNKEYVSTFFFRKSEGSLPVDSSFHYIFRIYFDRNNLENFEEEILINNFKVFSEGNLLLNEEEDFTVLLKFFGNKENEITFSGKSNYKINKLASQFQIDFKIINPNYVLDSIVFFVAYNSDFELYAAGGRNPDGSVTDGYTWTRVDFVRKTDTGEIKRIVFYKGTRSIQPYPSVYTCIELYFYLKQPNQIKNEIKYVSFYDVVAITTKGSFVENNESFLVPIEFLDPTNVTEKIVEKIIKIYPNPFTEFVDIDLSSIKPGDDVEVIIHDLNGEIKQVFSFKDKNDIERIFLTKFDNNKIFFLTVYVNHKKIFVEKILKN